MPLTHSWSDHDIVATVIGVCAIIWTASTWTISYFKARRDCALLEQAKETNRLLRKLAGEDETATNDQPPCNNPNGSLLPLHNQPDDDHYTSSIASRASQSIFEFVSAVFRPIYIAIVEVGQSFSATITYPVPPPSPISRPPTIHAGSRPGSPLQSAASVVPSPVLSARVLSVGSNASRRRSHKSASEYDV